MVKVVKNNTQNYLFFANYAFITVLWKYFCMLKIYKRESEAKAFVRG